MRTAREISSGGVVYRKGSASTEVALIRAGERWCLPKGQVEKGEAMKEAALREVMEETGLEGRVEARLGQIAYWYQGKDREGEAVRISKRAHFYLIRYFKGEVRQQEEEVDEACWVPISEAVGRLAHRAEKEIVQKAEGIFKEWSLKKGKTAQKKVKEKLGIQSNN